MTTKNKVKFLIQQNLLKNEDIGIIYEKKQELTREALNTLQPNLQLISLFEKLIKCKYSLFCCSNSNRANMKLILTKLGILDYFVMILGNNDVINPKPSPEIYNTIMSRANIQANETLILEDSIIGLEAAYASKAHVLEIKNVSDVNYNNIKNSVYRLEQMEV
jgi:HAD superfamily hydrolase (TIGR01509 family)